VDAIEGIGLDDTDHAILTMFHIEDRPLWDELIHECLERYRDKLSINGGITVRVVERRTTTLEIVELVDII
jgi:hypothetical protein